MCPGHGANTLTMPSERLPEDKIVSDVSTGSVHNSNNQAVYRPDILDTIDKAVDSLETELMKLSLDIHDHPELAFEETYAHDALTSFISQHGFSITKNYHLPTAWLATYTRGTGGRTIGINSEMDALPKIGHACGHNLIAISGIAVAIAMKTAMDKWGIDGRIELVGTPAEEHGHGKIILLEKGVYESMDVCLMCHPGPGPPTAVGFSSCLALQGIDVEFFGHSAHAALSPWEGQNALDAAVLAYTNISLSRQQLKPTHRVHGVFHGTDWTVNIIPDYAKMNWYIRAPTKAEVEVATKRLVACFEAAALATGCRAKIHLIPGTFDLRQNKILAIETAGVITKKLGGHAEYQWDVVINASTDFGNVTYVLPALHPFYAIPTVANGGNHTPEFAGASASLDAHKATLTVSKALAATGVRVLLDDEFFSEVRGEFESDREKWLKV